MTGPEASRYAPRADQLRALAAFLDGVGRTHPTPAVADDARDWAAQLRDLADREAD